jgi:lysophospholipase L1-like esterase
LINAGVNGDTIEDMEIRYQRDVQSHRPDFLMIFGGTNDAYRFEISSAEAVYHLERIIRKAQDDKISPLVALPMHCLDEYAAERIKRLRSDEQELAEWYSLPCLDFAMAFADPEGMVRDELYLDGVHPNTAGYESMGKTALSFFQSLFQR